MATAEQTVGAVLDATNKRYLVEHTEGTVENGTWWCNRYSDGWVEQGGSAVGNVSSATVNLMIEMQDTDYYCNCTRVGKADVSAWVPTVSDLQTTKFSANPQGGTGYKWIAKGYAKS